MMKKSGGRGRGGTGVGVGVGIVLMGLVLLLVAPKEALGGPVLDEFDCFTGCFVKCILGPGIPLGQRLTCYINCLYSCNFPGLVLNNFCNFGCISLQCNPLTGGVASQECFENCERNICSLKPPSP